MVLTDTPVKTELDKTFYEQVLKQKMKVEKVANTKQKLFNTSQQQKKKVKTFVKTSSGEEVELSSESESEWNEDTSAEDTNRSSIVGDWILVSFCDKRCVRHYIGLIEKDNDEGRKFKITSR